MSETTTILSQLLDRIGQLVFIVMLIQTANLAIEIKAQIQSYDEIIKNAVFPHLDALKKLDAKRE